MDTKYPKGLMKDVGAVSSLPKQPLPCQSGLTTLVALGGNVPQPGDIQITHHPRSNKDTQTMGREEFRKQVNVSEPTGPPLKEPWLPFRSREDFEFAEIVHDAAMNQSQIDNLIKFFQHCEQNPGKFTLNNCQDLKKSWQESSALLTNVSAFSFHVILPRVIFSHPTAFLLVRMSQDQSRVQRDRTPVRNLVAPTLGMDYRPPHEPGYCPSVRMGCATDPHV
jgi:hypothetical protein